MVTENTRSILTIKEELSFLPRDSRIFLTDCEGLGLESGPVYGNFTEQHQNGGRR